LKLRLLFLFLLLNWGHLSLAEDIIVTSKADAGIGTLREAIVRSGANGNAEIDHIYFNIPGALASDHVIKLLSDLPEITTDLVIDGSSQPGQEAAVNHAKVTLDGVDRPSSSNGFILMSVNGLNRFEMYGMVIRNFAYTFPNYTNSITPIEFSGLNKEVIIGAADKGNVFYNVNSIAVNYRDAAPHQIQNLTFKNNYLGIKENGLDIGTEVLTGLSLKRVHSALIGGDLSEEGNIIFGSMAIDFSAQNELLTENVVLKIRNNIFTANRNEEHPNVTVALNSIVHSLVTDVNLDHTGSVSIQVLDNVFGSGLSFGGLDNANIDVKRNFFGRSRDGSKNLPIAAHALRFLDVKGRVLVGGTTVSDGNVITNTSVISSFPHEQFVIGAKNTTNLELSHNVLYCNTGLPFLFIGTGPSRKPLEVFLKEKTPTYVAGTTQAAAKVELYYTDPECSNCQPKRYFATVTADANGKWRYDGAIETGLSVLASATLNQMTSEFSDPRIYMFSDATHSFSIVPQFCDNLLGKIIGPIVVNAERVEWVNEAGTVVGTTSDIETLIAGKYKLKAYQFGCSVESGWITIQDRMPQLTTSSVPQLIQPTCNKGGSILNIFPINHASLEWIDSNDEVKGNDRELTNVPAGSYRLRISSSAGCTREFGPYLLQAYPNSIHIDHASASIKNASCNESNGGISGIVVTGATTYKWINAGNTIVSNTLELDYMPPGNYRLMVGNSFCIMTTEEFTISLSQSSRNYSSTKVIRNAQCGLSNGRIEVIFAADQPVAYHWKNSSGQIVGNARILENIPPGKYDLYITNDLGCEQFLQQYAILNTEAASIDHSSASIQHDECGIGKGKITAPTLSGGQQPYFYEWRDKDDRILGSSQVLDQLKAGNYQLTIGDALSCSRQIITYSVLDQGRSLSHPVVNDIKLCTAGQVLIQVLQPVQGSYMIYNQAGNLIEKSSTGIFNVNVSQSQNFTAVFEYGGCRSLPSSFKVTIENDGIGKIANVFSPNGDGQNDEWLIPGITNYPGVTVNIYNRYGTKVFESAGYKTPFNGKSNGADLPSGTYYYIVDFRRACGILKGSLTIMR